MTLDINSAKNIMQKFRQIDNAFSKNTFFVEKNITYEILKNVHEYLNHIAGSITTGMTMQASLTTGKLDRSTLYIQNKSNYKLPLKIPFSDMVMIFDNEKNALKLRIDKYKTGLKISFLASAKDEYLNFGEIKISNDQIEYITIDNDSDMDKLTNCFMILGLFKTLLIKITEKEIRYEFRKATKQQKKREINKIQSDFKFITLDYMSLSEIQTLFKYEKPTIAGAKKEPHDRSGFTRKLKDGRKVEVKEAKINGGAEAVRFYNIK